MASNSTSLIVVAPRFAWLRPPQAAQGAAWLSAHQRPDRSELELNADRLARPPRMLRGTMRLRAVHRGERVSDFMWEFISTSVAPLLYCEPAQLRGRCMREVTVGPLGHPALIERYRRVFEQGSAQSFEQVHRLGDAQAIVVHCVTRRVDGVAVTLTAAGARAGARPVESASVRAPAQASTAGPMPVCVR